MPAALARRQNAAGRALLDCVAPGKFGGDEPLSKPSLGGHLDALYAHSDDGVRRELVCLSWAASITQGHKHEGWSFAEGLRFGLEESAA